MDGYFIEHDGSSEEGLVIGCFSITPVWQLRSGRIIGSRFMKLDDVSRIITNQREEACRGTWAAHRGHALPAVLRTGDRSVLRVLGL